ncbi:STAS domain-containing protein [Sedimenticola sp.]|uniref:STAS domain-containing protein n=1 Tax=Sedimenticola sp. TaxID=1940285 RepID=UPI003D097337
MLKVENEKKLCRAYIEGEMTIYQAAALKEALMPLLFEDRPVEINLGKVSEIDSAGVQLLLLAKKQRTADRRPLTLVDHNKAVLDVFELMNLSGYFKDPILLPGEKSGQGDRDAD